MAISTNNLNSLILPRLLLLFLTHFSVNSDSSLDTFVFGGCTQQKYAPNTPYDANLNSLLTSLVNAATYSPYNNFTILGSSPQDVVYGLYQCRGDLSMPDCATCIARAVTRTGELCPVTCGGAVQLEGCYVKYDNATFLGVEDKTVVMKKCGPSYGGDAVSMGRRDEVLASLEGSIGPYRLGGSGDVQGLAQCVGDLSLSECKDCVSEAIGRLKSDCGIGVYGEMYLAKCYVKYSIAGAVPRVDSGPHHGKSNDDEGEKTFAIIIGLLAGVALLIIFLTFLRKVAEGGGK